MIRTVEVIREHAAKALNDIDFTYNVRYSKNIVVHVGNTSTVHDLGGGRSCRLGVSSPLARNWYLVLRNHL